MPIANTNPNNNHDNDTVSVFANKIVEPLDDCPCTVVNISDHDLTESERKLLEKGLNFCPTPGEPKMGDLRRDLDSFHRNLRIKSFFNSDKPKIWASTSSPNLISPNPGTTLPSDLVKEINKSKVLKPSKKWDPPQGPLHLESFILANEMDLNKTFVKSPNNSNIDRNEREALKSLSKNHNIVIKGADKGGAVVIQNRSDYIREGDRQLGDTAFYKLVDSDLTEYHNREVTKVLNQLQSNGEISKSLERKLLTLEPRTPEIYFLPKIHKATRPPPGRPIVSANGCPTEKISALVDIYLRPYLPKIESYLKDTTHFLQKLNDLGTLDPDTLFCTLDVSSLYTNIPNMEGLQATARFLMKYRRVRQPSELSNTSICQLLRMVLTMNNFRFNKEHFLQIAGTAMGTRVAPTYANIFMSDFENRHVYTYQKQPLLWVRFIDDIFVVWTHGRTEIDKFIDHLNSVHNTIKFTSEISAHKVCFLDTWAILHENGSIQTDLYTKPTDSNNYLTYQSAHPPHCKKGIPGGQFLRLRRICSDEDSFIKHSIIKGKHFLRRGYPIDVLKQGFLKALNTDRDSLLKITPKDKNEEPPLILVTTFNPGFHGLRNIVDKNWGILGISCSTRDIHQKQLITGLRKPANLKDILVKAKLRDPPHAPASEPCNPCNTKTCRYCPKLNKSGRITCSATKRDYVAKHNVTCKSSNLIYCISCKRCGIQYVGQTKNRLMDRFQSHFYNIGHNKPGSVIGKHFNSNGHQSLSDVEIHILDFIHAHPAGTRSKKLRDLIEYNWIQRMHTNAPTGLNIMDPTQP